MSPKKSQEHEIEISADSLRDLAYELLEDHAKTGKEPVVVVSAQFLLDISASLEEAEGVITEAFDDQYSIDDGDLPN